MNQLWGRFEAKLSTILAGGKSFLLARDTQNPRELMGRIFYFISGGAAPVYALRAPGITVSGAPYVYDHTVFSNYLAALDLSHDIAWDDANRIATIPRVADATYGDLPLPGSDEWMGFFDHSLQAHTVMHQGPDDLTPQPYFVQDGTFGIPEKHLEFGLAEIIIEGTATTLDLPVAWDKYSCFRLHNLNGFSVTVTFGASYTLVLKPFECRAVRRDSPTANYRASLHYSFAYDPGDPRSYWFLPTTIEIVDGFQTPKIGLGYRAANSMAANNLANPAILSDWVNWLAITTDDMTAISSLANGVIENADTSHRYAWFVRDPSILWNARPLNSSQFGDPSNSATLLGDLIHHKGQILIARRSKTLIDPATSLRVVTWDSVTFNGYSTIVADFNAKQLTVAVNGSGDYQLSNADPDNEVDLIPIESNLLKSWSGGELLPVIVPLGSNIGGTPFTIETAIFENPPDIGVPDDFKLLGHGPWVVYQRDVTTAANSRTYSDIDPTNIAGGFFTTTVTGPDTTHTQINSTPASQRVLHGIHALTVADLLDLSWWGDKDLADQATSYVTFTNKSLTLTTEGLVLAFDETITDIPPAAVTVSNDWFYWATGSFTRRRVIRFRGHGWGYNSVFDGLQRSAFQVGRYGLFTVTQDYIDEAYGVNGADFSVAKLNATESTFKVLQRIKTSSLELTSEGCRFWKGNGHLMLTLLGRYQESGWYETARGAILGGTLVPDDALRAMALLPEHYNAMAQTVNQLSSGGMLTGAALFWRGPSGGLVSLAPTAENVPVPMDCYAAFPSDNSSAGIYTVTGNTTDLYWLYDHLGISIQGEADFPDDLTTFSGEVSIRGIARFDGTISGSVSAVNVGTDVGSPDGSVTVSYSMSMTGEALPVWEHRSVTGSGTGYLGTWNPTGASPDFTGGLAVNGNHYVVSQTGFDGSQWWLKGELAVYDPSLPPPKRVSGHEQAPSFAYVAQSGNWVQLRPDSFGTLGFLGDAPACAITSLGSWNPAGGLPADGTNPGDYYNISATSGGYWKGARIIWDGAAWQHAAHSYADFNWVTTGAVKSWFEVNGFKMCLNELIIPQVLERVEATESWIADDSQLSHSGDVVMDSVAFSHGATTSTALQAAQSRTVDSVPYVGFVKFPGQPGTRIQFSTVTSGALWKFRQDWWQLITLGDTPSVADLKEWVPDGMGDDYPEALAVKTLGPKFTSSDGVISHGGWTIVPVTVAGGIPLTWQVEPFNWNNEADVIDCAVVWKNSSAWLKSGIDVGTPYRWSTFAVYSFTSAGISQANRVSVVPAGVWANDGETWKTDRNQFIRCVIEGVRPVEWRAGSGTVQNISPGAGITYLTPPADSAAYLLPSLHVNSVAL